MPRKIDYPLSSFERSIELANAVDSLGGSCLKVTAADKMNQTMSGSFKTLIGTAIKFDLIKNIDSGKVEITQTYKDIKLAYNDEDKRSILIKSFLKPSVFKSLYEKFLDKELPVKILDKILIKEYGVNDEDGSKVGKYFTDGLKLLKLIGENNKLINYIDNTIEFAEAVEQEEVKSSVVERREVNLRDNYRNEPSENVIDIIPHDKFVFHIYGPGLDTKIQVQEEEDLLIVEATIKKVKKSLNENISN